MTPTEQDDVLFGTEFDDYDKPAPKLEDEREADWHLRRAQAIQREREQLAELFDAEISALQERKAELLEGIDKRAEWHLTSLEGWHRAQFAAGAAGKTIKLPHGESQLRGSQPKFDVHDEDALRGFLVMNGLDEDVYPLKEPTLSKAALKKAFERKGGDEAGSIGVLVDENGMQVPGVRVVALPDRFQTAGVKGKG